MKTMRLILVTVAALALCVGLAAAQITGEPMEGKTRNQTSAGTGNAFGCPTTGNAGSPACSGVAGATIRYRMYSQSAAQSTPCPNPQGVFNCGGLDGNPIFQTAANGSYLSDVGSSANFFGAGHAVNLPMNLVWDGQTGGAGGDHRGYYGAQSQLITKNGETGDTNLATCIGTRGIACFTPVTGLNQNDATDTPQGTIPREGGMRAVPVPTVSDSSPGMASLTWLDPTNVYVNDAAPDPVLGVHLYLRTSTSNTALDSRATSPSDLDANAALRGFFAKGTDGSTSIDCSTMPGVVSYIPVIKMAYQGADGDPSPTEGQFWSANGPTISCDRSLFTEVVNFKASYLGYARGSHTAEVSWETTAEDGTIGFNLLRGTSLDGPFQKVANLPAQGQGGEGSAYVYDDLFKVPGNAREVFYKLVVIESSGGDNAVGPIRMEIVRERGPKARN